MVRSSGSSSLSSVPTGRNVLVVEDEVRLRTMLSDALKEMGFQSTLVPTAEAAARAMAQQVFDILILDLNLPGAGGMEFLGSLRGRRDDVQVIILTGFGDLEAARKAIHFDVVEFLTKPCALGSLEMALERARKRRRAQISGQPGIVEDAAMQFDAPPEPEKPVVEARASDSEVDAPVSMEELEQQHILSVLEKNKGNRATTAAELGISLRKMYYRLGQYQKKGLLP